MAEYVGGKIKAVLKGECVFVNNKHENNFRVGTGLVFEQDGDYLVRVSGNKIAVEKVGNNMNDIKFYIPPCETVPTELRLYVGNVYVTYERTTGGFIFNILLDDEDEAMKIAERIVGEIKFEHDEPEHGISWRTISLEIVPQEERYKIGTLVEWKYRVRDSY